MTTNSQQPASSPLDVRATFAGKSMILLGATGFLGKVWLSMLLDRYPEIGTIYMMVRARKDKDPGVRFWSEIAGSPVFSPLRSKYPGDSFNEFLREKIVPIGGDIADIFLGIEPELRKSLRGKVDVIVNVSGVVDFNPPLDEALQVNAFGAQNLIELARYLGDIPVMHTSTCFVVGCRDGVTPERSPLEFPFPRADELEVRHWDADREIAECIDVVEQARRRVEDAPRQSHLLDEAKQNLKERREPLRGKALQDELEKVKRNFVRQRLIEAGKERAQFWGWPNIYTYTKSIGEQVLMRSGLPCTIVRPAIVESAVEFPVPGWCEGISTSSPIAYLIYKGHQNIPVRDHCHYDAIPVDYCSAGMIAALAALLAGTQRDVYQFCSSDINPLKTKRAAEFLGLAKRIHFKNKGSGNPLLNEIKAHLEPMIVDEATYRRRSTPAVHRLASKAQALLERSAKTEFEDAAKPLLRQVRSIARTTGNVARVFDEFMPFIAGNDLRFSAKNTRELMASLEPSDQERLPWHPEKIDWRTFWIDIHLPGMEKWSFPLLEEKLKRDPKALRSHDNLSIMLEDLAERDGNSVALSRLEGEELTRVTYRDLLATANTVAQRLQERGVGVGDRVVLGGRNHPDWASAFFGIVRAGATAVPVDKEYDVARLTRVVEASQAKVALLDEHVVACEFAACPRVDLHEICQRSASESSDWTAPAIAPDAVASILYTSGTTGDPKGVMLSHRNFTSLVAALAPLFPLDHRDRLLSVLPLHHTFEFTCGLLLPLSRGSRVIYLDEVNSDRLADGLKIGHATAMVGVPALWESIERRVLNRVAERGATTEKVFEGLMDLNRRLGRKTGFDLGRILFASVHQELGGQLRTLISGAAALPADTHKTFQGLGLHLAEGYGMTESAPVLSVARPGAGRKGGHVGKAIPGVELRLENINEQGVGEIVARGPNVMLGYADQPEATEETLKNGWLHTGDLGRFDKRGRLEIVGRSKEVIISTTGENVYPDDVETQLGKPRYIKELSVVGISDTHAGELIACVGVTDLEEKLERGELHRRALASLREAVDALPKHTRPAQVFVVDYELPRTATRKIQRKEVRKIAERLRGMQDSAHRESDASTHHSEVRKAVAAVARRPVAEIRSEHDLIADLGFDSLMVVDLTSLIEERCPGISLQRLGQCRTIAELEACFDEESRKKKHSSRTVEIEKDKDSGDIEIPEMLRGPMKRLLGMAQSNAYDSLMRTKVYGRANIPRNRNCIIIANHCSHLDVGLIKYGLGEYGRDIVSLGAEDYFFKDKWRRAYFENFTNVAPLDRKSGLRKTLQQVAEPLEQGKTVLIFPEGTRSPDGQMRPFLPLIGQMALSHKVDLLPIYLEGTFDAFPKGATLPKVGSKLSVRIGPALEYSDLEHMFQGMKRSDAFREVTRLAQEAVEALRSRTVLDLRQMARRSLPPVQSQLSASESIEVEAAEVSIDSSFVASSTPAVSEESTTPQAHVAHVEFAPVAPVVPAPAVEVSKPVVVEKSAMEVLMQGLVQGFVTGATNKPVSFYISVGDGPTDKWTIEVDRETCQIRAGRPADGRADCVLKTSPAMMTKIIKEHYVPSFAEFAMGKVKTNSPNLLKVFKKVFGL